MAERKRKESTSASSGEKAPRTVRRRTTARPRQTVARAEADIPTIARPENMPEFQSSAAAPAFGDADRDEIARLAYSYWEARGGEGGSADDDWIRAEQEIRRRRAAL